MATNYLEILNVPWRRPQRRPSKQPFSTFKFPVVSSKFPVVSATYSTTDKIVLSTSSRRGFWLFYPTFVHLPVAILDGTRVCEASVRVYMCTVSFVAMGFERSTVPRQINKTSRPCNILYLLLVFVTEYLHC
jgi:hypothetical protein